MADAQPNLANQLLTWQAMGVSPSQQKQIMASQQQEALAQALMQEGLTPINQNNRMMGNIASRISPWEGISKLGQVAAGLYGQHNANESLANALSPPQQNSESGTTGDNISGQQQNSSTQQSPGMIQDLINRGIAHSPQEAMLLIQDPTALARVEAANVLPPNVRSAQYAAGPNAQSLVLQQIQNEAMGPGQKAYQTGLGTQAAGNAPVGTLPGGSPTPTQPPPQINPMSGGPMMPPTVPTQGAGPQAPGAGAGGGTGMPPPVPVQGPQALPPIGAGQVPPVNASALQAPPTPPQSGLSVPPPPSPGISLPGPNPNAPPAPSTSGSTAMPSPLPGESNLQYSERLKAAGAGATKQAEATGEGLGKAQVGAATIDSRFDNAQQLLSQANDSAKDASYGIATGWKEDIHNQLNDKTSIANADYQNKMSQVLTQAIPGIVQATGGRIDIPLLNAIKAAENADISLSPSAKQKVIQDLSDALDQQRQNMHNQVTNLGGSAPATPLLRFGQTATNPQTGHQMTYMFGKWQ